MTIVPNSMEIYCSRYIVSEQHCTQLQGIACTTAVAKHKGFHCFHKEYFKFSNNKQIICKSDS